MKMPQSRAARGETAIHGAGKARITISLSKDKVRFIKAHSGQAGVRSVSAFIERLVAEAQARTESEKLAARTALYYDSLSALETKEQRAWGRLGELGLAHTEE
jgi:hypothetical protein